MFNNRSEAGQQLANRVLSYKNTDGIVLALPRGGIVVAEPLAQTLNMPLDVLITRKIGYPTNPEYAIGALAETGLIKLNHDIIASIKPEYIQQEIEREQQEIDKRLSLYRHNKPLPSLKNKIVFLVDDGIATGFTTKTALEAIIQKGPQKIILAIPVAPKEIIAELRKYHGIDIICLHEASRFFAVGQFYDDFTQVEDTTVITILQTHRK